MDILNETLVRYDELSNDNKFIDKVIHNYKCYMKDNIIKTIIKIVEEIKNKRDISLVFPDDFHIITDDNNDNINRIIYWSCYKTLYPDYNNRFMKIRYDMNEFDKKYYLQNIAIMNEFKLQKSYIINLYMIFILYIFIRWINFLSILFPLSINL